MYKRGKSLITPAVATISADRISKEILERSREESLDSSITAAEHSVKASLFPDAPSIFAPEEKAAVAKRALTEVAERTWELKATSGSTGEMIKSISPDFFAHATGMPTKTEFVSLSVKAALEVAKTNTSAIEVVDTIVRSL